VTTNWLSKGWVNTHEAALEGTVTVSGNRAGTTPGFTDASNQDYAPAGSPLVIDAAGPLPPEASAHPVNRQPTPKQGTEPRPATSPPDMGALERP
jgi:hypothetical protein